MVPGEGRLGRLDLAGGDRLVELRATARRPRMAEPAPRASAPRRTFAGIESPARREAETSTASERTPPSIQPRTGAPRSSAITDAEPEREVADAERPREDLDRALRGVPTDPEAPGEAGREDEGGPDEHAPAGVCEGEVARLHRAAS